MKFIRWKYSIFLEGSVEILFDEYKNSGSYKMNYKASKLSSGIYFYKLSSPELNIVKKFALIK